ncbi:hypothetical protein PORY_002225 [Pneumocystis oryctolagi]|uniref:Uncharacterized protein n=1 Tax=Pneumocystis oryctolagi TaxID=42067 RepID=A0ACB7CAV3_9ASCO|nr:hypothetical protein PORY_002225 [Pneumocystis oryctolagi]
MSYISDFIDFLNNSPTPFHVVKTVCKYLSFAGFIELKETECWSECIKPGNKYYVTRNTSSIIAFSIGEDWKPGNPIALSCAHVDSPSLKIKPISKKTFEGYLQVGIETYGGGIWHSWFDRDLGVAGRVMVQEKDGSIKQCLIDIRKPLMRIPTLAIHLDREVNQKFEFNKETQFLPILGLESQKNRKCRCADDSDSRHHNELLDFISRELKIEKEQIIDFELMLRDTQPACIGGINEEFVFSGRLDDQTMCYSILRGFLESLAQEDKSCFNSIIKLIALFDHEEVGSVSAHGAESTFLPSILKRLFSTQLAKQFCDPISLEQSLSKSFLISADMGHALHPNYYSKYESNHKPKLNKGLVLKINSNQRYATNSPGIALVHEIARRANTNIQFFVNDNTIISGSTIGPLLSKSLGIRAVDVGLPQLSMHSIREMASNPNLLCIEDVNSSILFFKSYYENYADIQKKITVD